MCKNTFLYGLFILLVFSGCNDLINSDAENLEPQDYRTHSVAEMYQIDLPNYMKKANDLNEDASLQFENKFKETYIAIIDEGKKEYVDTFKELDAYNDSLSVAGNYREIQMDYFLEEMTVVRKSDPIKLSINGLGAEQVEFAGRVPGVDFEIFYLMTFIEGDKNVYMMMQWTLSDRETKHKNSFYYSAKSFKEL